MDFPLFLANRIARKSQRTFSRLIVGVAIGTVAVGVAAMILAVAVLNGFKEGVSSKQRGFFGDIVITDIYSGQALDQAPVYLDSQELQKIHALPGIQGVYPFATKPGIIHVNGEVEGVVMKGIDKGYDQTFLGEMLTNGDLLDFTDSVAVNTQLLVSSYTANRLDVEVGDDFIMYFVQEPIRRRKFTIQGIYHTGAEELDKTYVIGALPLIARLNDWSAGETGGYEIQVTDFGQLGPVTESLNDQLPDALYATHLRARFPELFQWLDLLDANPQIILALMMIVAIINMISALLIIILEKTHMIGLLKALGFADRGLRRVFLYYAAYLVGIGLLVGNALALGVYFMQKYTRFIKLDEQSYYMSYVPVEISILEVGVLNAGMMVIALLVLLGPVYLIGKVNPVRSIQFR